MYLRECTFTTADVIFNPTAEEETNYVDFPPGNIVITKFNRVGRMKNSLFEVVIILND